MATAKYTTPAWVSAHTPLDVIYPAGRFAADDFAAGIATLKAMGLMPPSQFQLPAGHRHFAAGLPERLANVSAAKGALVWAVRGGSGCAQVLAQLPDDFVFDGWLVGFSDITTLHARQQAHGRKSLHAANITTLPGWAPTAIEELKAILYGTARVQHFDGQPLAKGDAHGPLCGGNLTVLASLVGTGLLPNFAGSIVLLEDIAEAPYRLERALNQLLLAGTFADVRGFVLGQMTRCGSDDELGPLGMFKEVLGPLNVPIVAGVALGHGPTSRAVVLGADATIDAQGGVKVQW